MSLLIGISIVIEYMPVCLAPCGRIGEEKVVPCFPKFLYLAQLSAHIHILAAVPPKKEPSVPF